nr:hypothetical protein [Paenibacillus kribbensis]
MLMNPGVTLLRVERARKRLHQVQKKYGFLTHPKSDRTIPETG